MYIMTLRKYYPTLINAESHRKIGERIYYKPKFGYYIIIPKKYKNSSEF